MALVFSQCLGKVSYLLGTKKTFGTLSLYKMSKSEMIHTFATLLDKKVLITKFSRRK